MIPDIVDGYQYTRTRKVLTLRQTRLEGLCTFGHDVSVKAQMPLIPHLHKGKMEFAVLARGTQNYAVDGRTYTLYGGDVFFTRPDEIHSTGDSPCHINDLYWFQLDLTAQADFLGLSGGQGRALRALLEGYDHRLVHAPQAPRLLEEAFASLVEGTPSGLLRGQALFLQALMAILLSDPQGAQPTADIARAKEWIAQNLGNEIDLESLADRAGLSVSRFKEKFIEQVGMSPREYVNHCRIEEAKHALRTTGQTLTEIAMALSFSSASYFSTVFRKFTGMTPSEYRNEKAP